MIRIIPFLLFVATCKLSPASVSSKLEACLIFALFAIYAYSPTTVNILFATIKTSAISHPYRAALIVVGIAAPLKYFQQKLRFSRINGIKLKFGYTDDPESWEKMTVDQAQEIESNMAEWEFPR